MHQANSILTAILIITLAYCYNTSDSYNCMLDDDILNDLNDLDDDAIPEQSQEAGSELQSMEGMVLRRSELLANPAFREHVDVIKALVDARINQQEKECQIPQEILIQKSNEYASAITKEISAFFRAVKAVYSRKFPQLESIVTQPALYCKAVREIEGGETAFAYLSNHQRISLQIAISSIHEQLPAAELGSVLEQVETVVRLNEDSNLLLMYLQSCMQAVAPNLCQLLGSLVASKLISIAGGIKELAAIPACNIQVMGGQRAGQVGLNVGDRNHTGIFGQMDIVRDAPQQFRMNLVRMLASNTAKCVRADLLKSQSGLGNRLREELYERFEKIQEEGGLHRIDLPLPVPDQQPKKRRGGKRYRKNKQLQEMSELRKQQNRLKFGEEAQEELGEGVGLGMLSQGTGKLRVNIKKTKLKVSKKLQGRANKKSGLQSSLNLNAAQGMELINPAQQQLKQQSGKQSIFGKDSGFQTVLNSKFGSYK